MAGPRLRNRLVILMAFALVLRGVGDVRAAEFTPSHGVHTAIVAGTPTSNEPSTGALLVGEEPAEGVTHCSAVLVGCRTVLTAAHCVCGSTGARCQPPHAPLPNSSFVYFQHAGVFRVAAIAVHPAFDFPRADVAVLRLETPVTGIVPARLDETGPPLGTPGRIVGFGSTGGQRQDVGLKRVGGITTGSCGDTEMDGSAICWTVADDGANTCRGDSGGPLFVDLGAGPVVAGITSGGRQDGCLAGDLSLDTRIAAYRSWIETEAGADVGRERCGGVPPAGSAGAPILPAGGTLGDENPTEEYTIEVPAGTNELRVALNGIDDGLGDFDLFLKAGSRATKDDYDCHAEGDGQYGYCGVDFPAAGTWYALVRRTSGAGAFQLTTTVVGGAAPICGNDLRETGEACDGADDAACPGACSADCSCAAVCSATTLVPLGAHLGRRFSVKALLLNDRGLYDRLDPRTTEIALQLDGAEAMDLAIPAGDDGWSKPDPGREAYRWRGRVEGARHVQLRCKQTRAGHWHFRVSGWAGR